MQADDAVHVCASGVVGREEDEIVALRLESLGVASWNDWNIDLSNWFAKL